MNAHTQVATPETTLIQISNLTCVEIRFYWKLQNCNFVARITLPLRVYHIKRHVTVRKRYLLTDFLVQENVGFQNIKAI